MVMARLNQATYETPTDTELVTTRWFNAPRALVFDMWTKPEHVRKWLLGPEGWTMPVCEIDLRPGGPWRFVWRQGDDAATEFGMYGEYVEVDPPHRVSNTEHWGPELPPSMNVLVLEEKGGRTLMTLTTTYASKEARDAALGTGMTDGMTASFDRLEDYLAGMASA
jgi:uncharacterized protein YndB with AHSA1/START domain